MDVKLESRFRASEVMVQCTVTICEGLHTWYWACLRKISEKQERQHVCSSSSWPGGFSMSASCGWRHDLGFDDPAVQLGRN